MFQYYTNGEYRQAYKFLSQLEFLCPEFKFHDIGFFQIRRAIQPLVAQKKIRFFAQSFNVLRKCKGQAKSMMKVLMFIHFILQTEHLISNDIDQLLIKQINNILQMSRQFCQKQRQKSFSTTLDISTPDSKCQKANKNIDNNILLNLQTKKQSHRFPKKFVGMSFTSTLQSCPSAQQYSNYQQRSKPQVHSSQQVLCEKFIEPYAIYLLKKSFVVNNKDEKGEALQTVNLWSSINTLNSIFKISQGISTISRYYEDQYQQLVLNVVQILDYDIKYYYTLITKVIGRKLKLIIEQQQKQQMNQKKQREKVSINRNKSYSFSTTRGYDIQLMQIKQQMKQVSQINQKLLNVYCGKHIHASLKQRNIRIPALLKPQSKQFQSIYQKIKMQDKMQEKRSRKQSSTSRSVNQSFQKSKINKLKSFCKLNKSNRYIQFNDQTMTPDRKPIKALKKLFSTNLEDEYNKRIPEVIHKRNVSVVSALKNQIQQLSGQDI